MADYGSGSYNGLSWGSNTMLTVQEIHGVKDLPTIRSTDQGRGLDHGEVQGIDLSDGRIISVKLLLAAPTESAFDTQLDTLLAATVPQASELPLLLFGGTRQVNCRPRGRSVAVSLTTRRTAVIDLQFKATDPRVLNATQEQQTVGLPTSGSGMSFGSNGNLLTANQASLEGNLSGVATDGWSAGTNTTLSTSTAQALSGSRSLTLTASAAGSASATTPGGTVAAGAIPVQPSTQYTGLGSFRAGTTGRTWTVGIAWYDVNGTLISTSTGSGVTDTSTGWTQASVTATSPSNAASAALVPTGASLGAGELHYADQFSLAAGSSTTWAAPSFAGVGFNLSFGGAVTNGQISAVNAGNFLSNPVAVIAGPVDNPTIENATAGQHVTFSLSLGATDTLTVDFNAHTVLLNGTGSRRSALTSDSVWWKLAPGTNLINYRANTVQVGSSMTLTWADAWV